MDSLFGSDTEVKWIITPPAGNSPPAEEDNGPSPWDEIGEEEVARWRRDGELGLEEALRQAGCGEQVVIKTLRLMIITPPAGNSPPARPPAEEDKGLSPWDAIGEEEVTRWRRDGELELEEALRQAGCAEHFARQCAIKTLGSCRNESSEVLNSNESTEKLDLNGIIVCGIEQFSDTMYATVGRGSGPKIIKVSSWRKNRLTCPTERDVIAFCVNLSSNRHIEELEMYDVQSFGTVVACTGFGNALANNSTLRSLKLANVVMEYGALTCLVNGLRSNKTLSSLELDLYGTGYDGFEDLSGFLANNSSLEVLHLDVFNLHNQGHKTLELLHSAWAQNTSLLILHLSKLRCVGEVLRPFYAHVGHGNGATSHGGTNTTIQELSVDLWSPTTSDWMDLAELIRTNKSLLTLRVHITYKGESPSEGFFPALKRALKENETLKTLEINCLLHVPNLLDVLRDNDSMTRLREIMMNKVPQFQQAHSSP